MIIFDFSQLIFNQKFIIEKQFGKRELSSTTLVENKIHREYEKKEFNMDDAINFLRHLTLNQILSISNKFKNETELVLAIDHSSWRKKFFMDEKKEISYYKYKRRMNRNSDSFDWEKFFEKVSEFQNDLQNIFPFNVVSIHHAEGDDVIGTLSEHVYNRNLLEKKNEQFIIISSDKDFAQLQRMNNVKQYSPTSDSMINIVNPMNELMWLILDGDTSDGIPNVKSPDDAYVTSSTVRMWHKKKVWEYIENNTVFSQLLITEELKKNFERNKKLIDLRECPEDIKQAIIEKYEANKLLLPKKGQLQLFQYFVQTKMKNMLDRVGDFERFMVNNKKSETKEIITEKKSNKSNILDLLRK